MSDPKYGEPVEEPTPVDDVVGRAHEGLADAEAARRDADANGDTTTDVRGDGTSEVVHSESVTTDSADGDGVDRVERVETVTTSSEDARTQDAARADAAPAEYEPTDEDYAAAGYVPADPAAEPAYVTESPADSTATTSYGSDSPNYGADTVNYAAAPVASEQPAAAPYGGAQPIFVQAPEAPQPRGNRGAAGAIGLLAALAFGLLYLGAWLGFGAINGEVTVENVAETALGALGTWSFWVPVVVFFLAFWLLGAIINRGRWGYWVIFGLIVGAASYLGHLLGQLLQAPFWRLTPSEGADLVEGQLLAPLAIAAFIFGRELTIWFGAWVASRGKRVTERNSEAQREYERTLEAGPQLYQQ